MWKWLKNAASRADARGFYVSTECMGLIFVCFQRMVSMCSISNVFKVRCRNDPIATTR